MYFVITTKKPELLENLEKVKKQCYSIEGLLAQEEQIIIDKHEYLSEEQMNVGLFSSNIRNAMSFYLYEQLNEIIHFLLKIPSDWLDRNLRGKGKNYKEINLISFRIFDLLRCKCSSGEAEIKWLIQELKERDAN